MGSGDSNLQYHVTWHHNHWKNVQSRSPLGRQADMHIYNNYYEGQTGYCMSMRASVYIFSEFNTFVNCKDVAIDEGSGGVGKSYGDVFTNCTGRNALIQVTDKTQAVEQPEKNTNPYFNFDTDPDSYVAKGEYKLDTAEDALKNIETYGGTLKIEPTIPLVTETPDDPGTDDPGTDEPGDTTASLTLSKDSVTIDLKKSDKTAKITATVAGGSLYVISEDATVADAKVSGTTITVTGKTVGETTVYAVVADTAPATVDAAKANDTCKAIAVSVIRSTNSGSNVGSVGVGGNSSAATPAVGTVTSTNTEGDKVTTTTATNGDKTITVTDKDGEVIAKVELPATVPALAYTFEDVPEGHWAEDAINTMAALGVVKGVSDENHVFDMTSNITRGAMAQILFNLSNGKAGLTETFADVAEGAWYVDAIAWAADAGVVTGYSEDAFGPDDSITREQLAVMLYRYAGLLGMNVATNRSNILGGFADVDSVSPWATDAVTWAVANGIIQGTGTGLNPTASASRAETAVMMSRFLDLV